MDTLPSHLNVAVPINQGVTVYNFNYYKPTHIVFGKDRIQELDLETT